MPSQEPSVASSGSIDSELLSTTSPKRSRIHFPAETPSPSRPLYLLPDAAQRVSPLNFRTSPVRQTSPLNPQKVGASINSRRRVRSVDNTADVLLDSPRPRRKPVTSLLTPPRGLDSLTARVFESPQEDDLGLSLFSDEYDLSHEDPKILQDVQRALKLKARREARIGTRSLSMKSERTPPRPQSNSSSPVPPSFPIAFSSTTRKESLSSDIDFSPSTSSFAIHPVPASLDNGFTLDWSGFDEGTESRWTFSGPKRKGKDIQVLPPLPMLVSQQEHAHADKLARLRTVTSPHTLRKAKITCDQLGRRYNLVYGLLSKGTPLNMAEVGRWYGGQDPLIRNSLEKAEPFTWLKHLDRRGSKPPDRLPWHLSALIMEEFIHAQYRHDPLLTIPEDSTLAEPSPVSGSPSLLNAQIFPITSRTSLNQFLPSLAMNSSLEDGVTFEPILESNRNSIDSRRSGESSFSSLPLGFSNSPATSPPKTWPEPHIPVPQIVKTRTDNNCESSSAEHSHSDHSSHHLAGFSIPEPNNNALLSSDRSEDEGRRKDRITLKLIAPTPGATSEVELPVSPVSRSPAQRSRAEANRLLGRRRVRTSLPSADRIPGAHETRLRQEADEEKAHELKARLLEETLAHNHRIRQLLNRISVGVREYEAAQSNAMASLGIKHMGLPRELLDAFGHDPAAVTGATRRFRGWRAVDDIQHRLLRQREVFQVFLAHANSNVSVLKSVLDDPIASLISSLDILEVHCKKIAERATVVTETLKGVQTVHTDVKKDYKKTVSHISVAYPEISDIVALEESYKDQYQQFWEFGMDTLTFLLDTVTPFWRTYGKPIGEDVRDFLIIPLYRNEFTGESKRYPIQALPSRSFHHWLALILFFFGSITINILQTRAAISSAAHYKLPMIPYESIRWTALPFFWISIIIQWWAVIGEFAVVVMQFGVLTWWAGWSVRLFD